MTNEISRRLLLKLAGAAGVTLALPNVPALAERQEEIPVFEYNDGSGWRVLGAVIDGDLRVGMEMIFQGHGVPPLKGPLTTTLKVEYFSNKDDPFADLDRRRFSVRINFPIHERRVACDDMMAVEHILSSSGKAEAKLISRRIPDFPVS
ncbi:hypothetical protein SAMN05216337_1001143 [Bradyrhizobium brasilense]|uniref:Twin-arginine translocation signal domain-containing protein n=1 Tax=Bradyrhizobium brasilense TaxID=1419277 RepID=A0A1G6IIV6_9BRAD|nr:hypothetical protein [Bradyrhizobium brasilense]SDC05666.1 hypothetical protein SAMN05216337_1001143 [Bradyrhizobium brasilense]